MHEGTKCSDFATDARFRGVSTGASIGHISPERTGWRAHRETSRWRPYGTVMIWLVVARKLCLSLRTLPAARHSSCRWIARSQGVARLQKVSPNPVASQVPEASLLLAHASPQSRAPASPRLTTRSPKCCAHSPPNRGRRFQTSSSASTSVLCHPPGKRAELPPALERGASLPSRWWNRPAKVSSFANTSPVPQSSLAVSSRLSSH